MARGDYKRPEYWVWRGMRTRCNNQNERAFVHYGGRGIRVCPEWDDPRGGFEAFIAHVGPRPTPDHEIDRINNDGNYEPGNVRWATRKQQLLNRRCNVLVPFRGERLPLTTVAEIAGVRRRLLESALERIEDVEAAIESVRGRGPPLDVKANTRAARRLFVVGGERLSATECSRRFGIPMSTIFQRLRYGWSEERAITEPVHRSASNGRGK